MIYSTEGHLFSSTEAQDPTIAAEGPTGCKLEFRITLLSFYSGKMVLLTGSFMTFLQDVMNKVRSDNILDMNLEKSRVKELVSV